jgi:hypothetical protein
MNCSVKTHKRNGRIVKAHNRAVKYGKKNRFNRSVLSKEELDNLYKNKDQYDSYAEQGVVSPHEANLMRTGKYKKP